MDGLRKLFKEYIYIKYFLNDYVFQSRSMEF